MARKLFCVILFTLCLTCSAQAITISSDIDTNIGAIPSGSSITFNLKASNYEASRPSLIHWTVNVVEGFNPGFRLNRPRGEAVTFSAPSLNTPRSGVPFRINITATDTNDTTDIITLTGRVMNRPSITTERLASVQAGGEKKYLQRLDFNFGANPIELTVSGDLPKGIELTNSVIRDRSYHVLSGDTEQVGNFPFTLIARNAVGSDSRDFTLQVDAVAPRIRLPRGFQKNYTVLTGRELSIDLGGLQFIGTRPLKIDIDEASKAAGLFYDGEKNIITGTIPDDTRARRLNVELQASNPQNQSSSTTLALTIQNPAGGIRLSPTSKLRHITDDSLDFYVLPITIGRNFSVQFRADTGIRPITWDYVITSMDEESNGKKIVKDLGGKFGGFSFAENGTITGSPTNNGRVSFVAEASNVVGTVQTEPYEFIIGSLLSFDRAKTTQAVKLLNGREVAINIADYLVPETITVNERFPDSFNATGTFPKGLTFDGKSITGTPRAESIQDLKRYAVNIIATNAFGTARSRINFDLQDYPRIGIIEDITAKVGTALTYTLPANAKRPYTWRMVYDNEEVEDEIGDSGIMWNPRTGAIFGSRSKMLDGTYRVTVYLKNDVGEDSKTFTIQVNP